VHSGSFIANIFIDKENLVNDYPIRIDANTELSNVAGAAIGK
jgi:hypothetical protein